MIVVFPKEFSSRHGGDVTRLKSVLAPLDEDVIILVPVLKFLFRERSIYVDENIVEKHIGLSLADIVGILKLIFTSGSITHSIYWRRSIRNYILLENKQSVYFYTSKIGWVYWNITSGKQWLDFVDCLSLKYGQLEQQLASGIFRFFVSKEKRAIQKIEQILCEQEHYRFTAITKRDARLLGPRVEVLPNYFAKTEMLPTNAEGYFLFIGNLSYLPNRLSLDIILGYTMTRKLIIAGTGALDSKREKIIREKSNVFLLGEYDDVSEILNGACLTLAPMAVSGGVQNKVVESWLNGRIVLGNRLSFSPFSDDIFEEYILPDQVNLEERLKSIIQSNRLKNMERDMYEYAVKNFTNNENR